VPAPVTELLGADPPPETILIVGGEAAIGAALEDALVTAVAS